jgi:RNA polymerase sigma-70 factor (ECF subfamily)
MDDALTMGFGDRLACLQYLKALYGAAFRDPFRAALAGLGAREKNILRQHFLDGMTLDDLGSAYEVHRVTAARWIQGARVQLLKGTRAEFAKTARLRPGECDSVLRVALTSRCSGSLAS